MKVYILKSISKGVSGGIDTRSLYDIFRSNSQDAGSKTIMSLQSDSSWTASTDDLLEVTDLTEEGIKNALRSIPEPTDDKIVRIAEGNKDLSYLKDRYKYHVTDRIEDFPEEILRNIESYKNRKETRQKFVDYLESYFGERFSNNDFNITIYFPKKEVTNSNGTRHTIYDVYLNFHINENMTLGSMAGRRTTLSEEEFNGQYMFSHFRPGTGGDWSSCCLGSGTTLSHFMNSVMKTEEEYMLSFCLALEYYLTWESLEGGPYVRMSSFLQRNNTRRNLYNSSVELMYILGSMYKNNENLFLNIDKMGVINPNVATIDKNNPFLFCGDEQVPIDFEYKPKPTDEKEEKKKVFPIKKRRINPFVFRGKKIEEMVVDPNLNTNKNPKEKFMTGDFYPDRTSYEEIKFRIGIALKSIINEQREKYTIEKPAYAID